MKLTAGWHRRRVVAETKSSSSCPRRRRDVARRRDALSMVQQCNHRCIFLTPTSPHLKYFEDFFYKESINNPQKDMLDSLHEHNVIALSFFRRYHRCLMLRHLLTETPDMNVPNNSGLKEKKTQQFTSDVGRHGIGR
ncbi:hypothetical protein DICVIV_01497 [Dictyocaulus viviparus]|uniref:Uncharacterized protein n=1 Tax=Dictyocaulus viviparus TaxID=29172 RepID=A0A0D8Y6F2_DICVI|nr:hypothetical protein DICVIV_01497 [Dictyocaulus viviparus]